MVAASLGLSLLLAGCGGTPRAAIDDALKFPRLGKVITKPLSILTPAERRKAIAELEKEKETHKVSAEREIKRDK